MTLDPDYQLFANVVDYGSLSAAGRALGISPAMVSKRLARLEQRLGVRLIHRTTRRLSLTPAGAMFNQDIQAILEAVKQAEDRVTGIAREPSGPLRVSAPTSFGRLHVAPRLPAFLARFPRVELALNLSDAYVDLVAAQIDVAVRISGAIPAHVEAHRIATSQRVLTASPAYIDQHGSPQRIGDLTEHRLLAADGQLPWTLVSQRQTRIVNGRSHMSTDSSEVVRELAIAGVGIALRSMWDVSNELRDKRLVRLLPQWSGPRDLGIFCVHRQTSVRSPAIDAFVAFMSAAFDHGAWDEIN
jgi:DNA-binding transcriptional LysR family regulator